MIGRTIGLFAMLALLGMATAHADTPAPVTPDAGATDPKARARKLFDQAQARYDLGEYDDAIAQFREAYQISQAPALLFNIAQAHRLKGDCPRALQVYRHFVRLDPASPHRASAEAQITSLKARCESPSQSASAVPSASAPVVLPPSRSSNFEVGTAQATVPSSPTQGRVVLGLLATGLLLTGAATTVHLWNDSRFDSWQKEARALDAGTTSETDRQRRQVANDELLLSVRGADTITAVLAIAAGASLMAGTALFVAWEPISLSTKSGPQAQIGWKGTW